MSTETSLPLRAPARHYVGRFAPSPSGPLHAGSVVAALASFLDARAHQGHWQLRIDDIDPPRTLPEADQQIRSTLTALGLVPDSIHYQSHHSVRYQAALTRLEELDLVFQCTCTRSTLGAGGICVGDCQHRSASIPAQPASLRVRVPEGTSVTFEDLIHGTQRVPLAQQQPNFIIKRKDQFWAYQLAAACDDGFGDISHVIRGSDLLDSTFRQIFLQQTLGLTTPHYGHLPLVYGADGHKLSKQTGAAAVDDADPINTLLAAAHVLGLAPPAESHASSAHILAWCVEHWDYRRVPR